MSCKDLAVASMPSAIVKVVKVAKIMPLQVSLQYGLPPELKHGSHDMLRYKTGVNQCQQE
jgi:hypothetical protein